MADMKVNLVHLREGRLKMRREGRSIAREILRPATDTFHHHDGDDDKEEEEEDTFHRHDHHDHEEEGCNDDDPLHDRTMMMMAWRHIPTMTNSHHG